ANRFLRGEIGPTRSSLIASTTRCRATRPPPSKGVHSEGRRPPLRDWCALDAMGPSMSARSTVLERFSSWLEAEDSDSRLRSYRRVFACIWTLYDVADLSLGATERARGWFPHDRSADLVALQVVLIVSGIMLALGRRVWVFGMLAAAARTMEAWAWFPLNDFL